jgi:hypothetical protein
MLTFHGGDDGFVKTTSLSSRSEAEGKATGQGTRTASCRRTDILCRVEPSCNLANMVYIAMDIQSSRTNDRKPSAIDKKRTYPNENSRRLLTSLIKVSWDCCKASSSPTPLNQKKLAAFP